MYGFIRKKLVTVSTIRLVGISAAISIIITVFLTGITSLVMLGRLSPELLLANSIIGTIVPVIVAPVVISLLKQATNWEQVNQALAHENAERKRLEELAAQKASNMQAVNDLAIECAAATPDVNIYRMIAEKLRDITNAVGVGVNTYDPSARSLTTRHIAVSGQALSVANQLIGFNLLGMVTHVTPEMEKHMLTGVTDTFTDLSDVSFGHVPKPVAIAIKNVLDVGSFTGLALCHGGKLIGTAIIAHHKNHANMDIDTYKALAHVSAVAIQRKDAEDSLRENEIKFRTLVENLSEGIILLDEKGFVIEWNPAQENITDIPRKDALGQPIWEIQSGLTPKHLQQPGYHEEIERNLQTILSSGEAAFFNRPMAGMICTSEGKFKHILQSSFPIRTQNGYRIGSVMRDITAQKQAEIDREDLIAELKAKNTELEQFTYTVSHDLKAPIITILGFLGLLEKDASDGNSERLKRDIARITEAAGKMQRLLNELLELSRIGRIVNPSKAVPFEQIVRDAATAVHGRLETRQVQLRIMENLPIVFVDHMRANQVVQNLLDNSAKFMGEQPNPQIEVGMQGMDADGKPILFVKDNGIGIDPKHLDNVLGLFKKLDVGTDGTGIGLALAKRIVDVHGGRIWLESEGIGKGTTVLFTFPTP